MRLSELFPFYSVERMSAQVLPTAAAATEATARPDGVVERRYRLREAALVGAGAPRDYGPANRQSRKQR
jgi:hypothetical protein